MDENLPLARRTVFLLLSPGVLKFVASVIGLGVGISFLTKIKAQQMALRGPVAIHMPWTHGTSDTRMQQAIDRDDGVRVAQLLEIVPRSSIRDNIVFRLSFDKTSHSLDAFLKNGWSVEGDRHDGQPLLNALTAAQPKALKVLLKHGANPNVFDNTHRSAMIWASSSFRSSPKLIEILGTHGAKIDEISTYQARMSGAQKLYHTAHNRPLTVAAFVGNTKGVQLLLDLGAKPDMVQGEDIPPIAAAAYAPESAELAKILLDHGANPNAEGTAFLDGPKGATVPTKVNAIFLNTLFGRQDAVKLLLAHGAVATRQPTKAEKDAYAAAQAGLKLQRIRLPHH